MDEITISRETAEQYVNGEIDTFERSGATFYKGGSKDDINTDHPCILYTQDMQRLIDGEKDSFTWSGMRDCTLSIKETEEHTLTETLSVEQELVESEGELSIKDSNKQSLAIECSCGETFNDDEKALDHIQQPHEIEEIINSTNEELLTFEDTLGSYMVDLNTSKVGIGLMSKLNNAGYFVSGILRVNDNVAEENGYDSTNVMRFWLRDD